jgi:molybdopterin converting factor subunit 1
MKVTVRLFAVLRERAGTSALTLELSEGSKVATVLSRLREERPALAEMLEKCAVAVNRAYVARDATLHDGDEVAVIPPVSGG